MKRATVAVWLSVFALLTLGLSGCGSSSSTPASIGVALTPNGTKSIDQAQTVSITAAISNDSKSAGVTWTVSGTNGSQGTLTNQTTTPPYSVTYNTPASVTSAFTATVTATSVTDTTKVAVLKITVSPLPSVTTTSLAAATPGTAYSATLVEAGGTSPYTWTVTPATLPAGLSLNSSTGAISGMPTGGGSGNFTFKVTDAAGESVSSQSITFTVAAPPALTVTTATLPAAVMGTAYSQSLQATGGVSPYTWSVPPGTLPAGLSLNSSTGVISGTPTGLATGPIPFTVTVTDVATPTHATTPASLSIAVSAPALSVTTSSLPGGTMGNAYSQTQLTAKGGAGADTWKLASGSSLPAGLILSSTGVITGTPSGNVVGPTSFTVVVTDSETPTAQTATAGLSIAITVAPLSVTTSGSLPAGVANSVYPGVTLQPTGGIPPYINWSVVGGNTNLPPGLTLNAATGAISGTSTTAGTTTFTVTVTDSEATPKTATSATLSITVNPALSVTTNSLPAGVVGTSYPAGTALQAAGGVSPYTWAVTTGSVPAGLNLNASTGAITGKPTGPAVGTISFTVTVTDSESPTKTATQNLSIVITAPQLTVTTTTASLPTGVLSNTYSTTLAASGGAGAYTWAVTGGNASLPAGLTLNPATGVISGTPTATGQTTFTVTVTDSETPTAQTASASLTISVNNSAPLGITTTTAQLPTGITGTAYPSTTLQASGGVTPYTWSYTGNLPTSLSLSSSGVITGTPTVTGTFSFTVKVTDSTKPTANTKTASLSITVDTPITVTTTSPLPTGYVGLAYSPQTLAATGGSGKGYTWAVTSGSTLPAGLNLSAAGVLSGKPTTAGNSSFSVTVTDSASNTGTGTLSITIKAGVSITTGSPLPTGYVGSAYSQTLTATGGSGTGYTWSVASGSTLPGGLTLSAAGVLSGKPTTVGTPSFSVTVTDSVSNTATAAFSMTVSAGVNITTGSPLPVGYQLAAYPATTFAATGGTGTGYSWTWAAASGSSLPAGLNLSTAGLISGAPTAAGTFSIVVTVTDSALNTASATFSLTVEATLTITTTSPLKTGTANVAYSQQLAATGGTGAGTYTWSTNAAGTSSLTAVGLSLSSAGLVSSALPSLGTANFTATVTDSASHTASLAFAVTINNQLTITTTTLPAATTGVAYSRTLSAAGGSGTGYTWSVSGTSNLATYNLSLSTAGVISGTPAATGTASFTAKVTDSASSTATQALTIQVYNALTLPTPNPSSLGSATVGQFYTGTITASGGSGNYTWTVTGLTDNLGSSSNGATLTISGPPNTPTVVSFNVSVQDNNTLVSVGPVLYTITVNSAPQLTLPTPNPNSLGSATVNQSYSGTISASGGVPPYTWTVNGAPVPTSGSSPLSDGLNVSTNAGGNPLAIGGTPSTTGTVTLTNVIVTDSTNATAENTYTIAVINPAAAYTVSGTVTYTGTKTGQVYLALNSNNCNGCGSNQGTSIPEATLKAGGNFTIHGVQPGNYTLQAFMDNLGYGAQNASNPTGSSSSFTVTNTSVNGISVTLNDPTTPVTISSAPTWSGNQGSGAFSGGAFVSFQSIQNNNGIEMPASYTVGWSTSQSCSSFAGTKSFPATGQNNPWIVTGLTTGQTYYFCAKGVAGSSAGPWSSPSSGVLIESPSATGNYLVSGSVTFTTPATGPLYVGFYDQNSGNVYVDAIASPKSPQAYSVYVPAGSNYYFFGVIDQANSGLLSAPGQISNTNSNNAASVAISGTTPNENLTLPTVNSTASVQTQAQEQINSGSPSSTNYSIGFKVNSSFKLPVAVELASGPTGAVMPADIANGTFNGSHGGQFSYWTNLNGATPKVGDSYTLNVTYSDGTLDVMTVKVSAVLDDAFATNLLPQGNGVSVQPNFSWTDPNNASNYTYQFWLCCGPNGTIWQIPGNNSNSNGFSSAYTSIKWGTDPTGSGNLPNVSSLNGSTYYSWQIQATDINGNSAQVGVNFQTAATPLSLPAAGSLGNTVIGQNFNGAINASGGVSSYSFTVNNTAVNTNGTPLELGTSGLYVSNTGGNTLSISGTPTSVGVVSFTVAVTDSTPTTIGPYTYTIAVSNEAPVSLPAAGNDPLGSALVGTPYGGTINASGGAGGGNYSFTVNGTTVPNNMTYVSVVNGDGLTVANSGGNTLSFAGTPATVETVSLAVTVIDTTNSSDTASVTYTLPVVAGPNGANNGNLKGTYVCKLDGFADSDGTRWASLSSVTADGKGNLTGGIWDTNGTDFTTEESGTLSGTYSIGADNNGLATTIAVATSGGSGTHTSQFALALTNAVEPAQQFRMVETDDIGSSPSGQHSTANCYLATTSAFAASTISGHSFVFGMQGENSSGTPKAYVGRFAASGGTINSGIIDGMRLDQTGDNGGTFTGSYTAPNTNGRFTLTITPTGQSGSVTMAIYIIDANRMFMLETGGDSGEQAGEVRKQLQTSYSGANLNAPFVLYSQGYNYSSGAVSGYVSDVFQGTGNGTGGFTINQSYQDNQGTSTTGSENGGPITVTFDTSNPGRATFPAGESSGYLYFFNNNAAFELDLSGNGFLASGWMVAQSQTTFTDAAVAGTYMMGKLPPTSQGDSDSVGEAIIASSGTITGSQTKAGEGEFNWAESLSGQGLTYSWLSATDGTFSILSSGEAQLTCAVISSTELVCSENNSESANVNIMQQ